MTPQQHRWIETLSGMAWARDVESIDYADGSGVIGVVATDVSEPSEPTPVAWRLAPTGKATIL